MNKYTDSTIFSEQVVSYLTTLLDQQINKAIELDNSYARLWQSIKTVVLAGGKRMRPKIIYMSYKAFGGKNFESIIPIAAAHELLHIALLIHDDIIDRDNIRHGVKNINGLYLDFYKDAASFDRTHFAHSASLLAGDLLISEAYNLIFTSDLSLEHKIICSNLLHSGIFEVASGELLDTESAFLKQNKALALKICEQKTASYSLVMPLLTGAKLANASNKDCQELRNFGIYVGVAYQLTDDLLGVFGIESVTGKSVSSDLIESKQTCLIERFKQLANPNQLNLLKKVFGNEKASSSDINKLKSALVECGAKTAIQDLIKFYAEQSRQAIKKLPGNTEKYSELENLISKISQRTY